MSSAELFDLRNHPLFNYLVQSRTTMFRHLMDSQKKDIDKECGYPTTIEIEDYWKMYAREGIGTRLVDVFPDECWKQDPLILENEEFTETPFEVAVRLFFKRNNSFALLEEVDKLSRVGTFGIILFGLNDGKTLDKPVEGFPQDDVPTQLKLKLLFQRTFSQRSVKVKELEKDPLSPRFGLPTLYEIDFENTSSTLNIQKTVHWTRVLHVADSKKESMVFGTPAMESDFNRLLDLRKVLGASGEAYWKTAYQTRAFEANPDLLLKGATLDTKAMKDEVEKVNEGMQKDLFLQGVSAKVLDSRALDPSPFFTVLIKAIAISKGIPWRILMGSEEAKLASSQDSKSWNERIHRRQTKHIEPNLLNPYITRCIQYGFFEPPSNEEGYIVQWQDLNALSDREQSEISERQTNSLTKYVSSEGRYIVPPKQFLTEIMKFSDAKAEAMLKEASEDVDDSVDESELEEDESEYNENDKA